MSVLSHSRRLVLAGVVLLVMCYALCGTATAADPAAPAGAVTAASAADVEAQIRTLLPGLKDRATGADVVAKLSALRDERVLHLFERLRDKAVYTLEGKAVYVASIREEVGPDKATAKVADVYDLLAPLDAAGKLTGPPEKSVPEKQVQEFSIPRPVRNAVLEALRVLGLKMDNPVLREAAARDLGMKQQADALADLQNLAKNDPDRSVRAAAQESVDQIILGGAAKATADDRIAAIKDLGDRTSLKSLDLINETLKTRSAKPDFTPAEAAAYQTTIAQINRHQVIANWISYVFFGLSSGSIYVLLALGLAITFGLMGVINMAHGEMMMIGAVTTWACCEYIGKALPAAYFDWYYVIAFPISFLVAAAFGLLIEVSVVRWLYKRPLDSLLATIGVSYVLIQLVRNWKGDNLGLQTPSWAGRNWEIFQDVPLAYNRLFLIALTIFCLLSVVALFRFTKLGLMIRATVQNREMAQALGVNTRLVDMVTFAFGAGLAGLAGYGIVLTSNPSPEIGQTFIVKSFLTVVVGGVGKLAGVIFSGLGLGFIEKLLEPITILSKPIHIFDATWAQVAALIVVILFMQRRPGGLFPDKGRAADQADRVNAPTVGKITKTGDLVLGLFMVIFGLVIVPALYGTGLMSPEFVNKLGYIFSFAICAIGLDLIWGYIGVLSLTQFLFFAIGGYCMGLYLVNYGPMDGENHNIPRALYVVMSAVSGATPPWFLVFFKSFPVMVLMGMLLPGLLALLIGLTTFRSRVRGVYFSILTQAITTAFWLVFQKNDMGLGGTNGLTNFVSILGFPLQGDASAGKFAQTRFWLYVASFVALCLAVLVAKLLVNSGFGRVLVAIRDDETRLRFVGYQTWAYKAAAFTIAAAFAGVGGMLYVPQKGIITPQNLAAIASIQVVAWVAVGGRGTVWGAVIGAIFVSLVYEYMTSIAPAYWYYVLGGMFVLVPLLLPGGIVSLPTVIKKASQKRRTGSPVIDTAAGQPAPALDAH